MRSHGISQIRIFALICSELIIQEHLKRPANIFLISLRGNTDRAATAPKSPLAFDLGLLFLDDQKSKSLRNPERHHHHCRNFLKMQLKCVHNLSLYSLKLKNPAHYIENNKYWLYLFLHSIWCSSHNRYLPVWCQTVVEQFHPFAQDLLSAT